MRHGNLPRMATVIFVLGLSGAFGSTVLNGQAPQQKPAPKPGPMLDRGTVTLEAPDFKLTLVRSSQTVAALEPKAASGFDFTPGDRLVERSQGGFYHLGDLDLRLRRGGTGDWSSYSTAQVRKPVTAQRVTAPVLAAADLAPTLPADFPLKATRTWLVDDKKLVLRFELTNPTSDPIEIGALGMPMVFNNILSGRSLDEAHARAVFYDPYIGLDAGYLQVIRLSGHGPVLLVVPDGRTPFEAWKPILTPPRDAGSPPPPFTDPTPRGVTFEGFFDWMVHSRAFAENEWKQAEQWNPPTSVTLAPGESRTYGVRFIVADAIRTIEATLVAHERPIAVGLPGYILPTDLNGRLYLDYPKAVSSIQVVPAGAVTFTEMPPTASGWKAYGVQGHTWGRARVTVTYEDGLTQTIHYRVTKPAAEAVADLGRFLTTRQWFVDPDDPFKRSPSVMSYDREEDAIITQDSRAWIAGLGDEGGSAWVSGAVKQLGQPDKGEIAKYQEFIDKVVWGGLQHAEGEKAHAVRKSLFYYQPDEMPEGYYRADFNWTTWTSWDRAHTERVDRSYNYPHVAALHWSMYRLARNHVGLVTNHTWEWYLTNAWKTGVAMVVHAPKFAEFGQMEGTVFLEILHDLRREGWTAQADEFEAVMRKRADVWMKLAYPFGSEMPWDSTGQEEVYAWTKHFGDRAKAQVTLDAILAYMPAIPHWGYNGSARRYWDFLYAGKVRRVERQLHHYGSSLNAIPVLSEYRDRPDDYHLLRIGYAGTMGSLTNIDQEGFGSAAFHSFPDMLAFDPITGDYAQNFFGHTMNTATYLVNHPEFGWFAFGGNADVGETRVAVTPLDSFRTRIYIAPLGLWLTLDAGTFEAVEFLRDGTVRFRLAPATAHTPVARLRVEQPARPSGVGTYAPTASFTVEREAYVIPLSETTTSVELAAR